METILSNLVALFSIYSGIMGFVKKSNATINIFYISIGIMILILNIKFR